MKINTQIIFRKLHTSKVGVLVQYDLVKINLTIFSEKQTISTGNKHWKSDFFKWKWTKQVLIVKHIPSTFFKEIIKCWINIYSNCEVDLLKNV